MRAEDNQGSVEQEVVGRTLPDEGDDQEGDHDDSAAVPPVLLGPLLGLADELDDSHLRGYSRSHHEAVKQLLSRYPRIPDLRTLSPLDLDNLDI